MFKRVRWMGMGAVAGLGLSAWAQVKLRRTLDEHPGIRTGVDGAAIARRVGREVRAAVVDGRSAMQEREAALRAGLDQHVPGATRLVPPPGGRPPRPGGDGRARGGAGPAAPRLRIVDARAGEARTEPSRDHPARGDASHPAGGAGPGGAEIGPGPAPFGRPARPPGGRRRGTGRRSS